MIDGNEYSAINTFDIVDLIFYRCTYIAYSPEGLECI